METRAETSPLSEWRNHLARGELAFQRDTATGQAVFYPRMCAPGTGHTALAWEVSKGLGTVYAATAIAPREGPVYNVALIDMDEGFRLMSRVESVPADKVAIGQRVKVRVHQPSGEEPPYPVFDIVEPA